MGKIWVQPLRGCTESVPPGWNRVKVSKNLGATTVVPVNTVVTSLGRYIKLSYQRLERDVI